MPVNTKHPAYVAMEEEWKKCLDTVSGERAVKDSGALYLPALGGQTPEMYEAYKMRASFYAAAARTVEGMTGVVFRKDPLIVWPDNEREYLDTIGNDDATVEAVMRTAFKQVFTMGRHGILLDVDESDRDVTPYLVHYDAQSILNWRTRRYENSLRLSLVVLQECDHTESEKDKYILEDKRLIRVLMWLAPGEQIQSADASLITGGLEGTYVVEVYEPKNSSNTSKDEYQLVSTRVPTIRGKELSYIPFVFINPMGMSAEITKPPVLDICNLNLSHYRSSADLEHGRHFTALPTAWASGFQLRDGEKLSIGSQTAWVTENLGAQCGFLEFTGQGLLALEKALEQKETQMVILGARMLEAPKAAVESADTHRTRKVGEDSLLASMAGAVSEAFERLLRWAAEWKAMPQKAIDEVETELNKDYSSIPMDPTMLQALLAALQSGQISYDTFVWNLQRGELIPEGRTAEDELDLIDKMGPRLNGPMDNLDDPTDVTNPNYDPTKDPNKNPLLKEDPKKPPFGKKQPPFGK